MYGDTTVIRHLARSFTDQGNDIRRRADDLLADAARTPWRGRAADAMRQSAVQHAMQMRRTAQLHDEAAAALVRHAQRVDEAKALIASIERQVEHLVSAALDRLADLANAAKDAAGDIAGALGMGGGPDPLDRLLARFDPPASGSIDWLGVDLPGISR